MSLVSLFFAALDSRAIFCWGVDEYYVALFAVAYKQNAMRHPKYRNGSWTLEKVMQDFLNGFDSKDSPDGVVTRDEFIQYYAAVSATIDDDAYFEMCMRSAWGLPSRKSVAQ